MKKRTAWCKQCLKVADGWDQRSTKEGITWIVRCHGERFERSATWGQVRHRAPQWFFEGLFVDTPIFWKDRRPPTSEAPTA